MSFRIRPRTIVKLVAGSAYHVAMTSATTAALTAVVDPQTESSEENVEVAGFVAGSLIWWSTVNHVYSIVDTVADRRIARKAAKTASESEEM